jgi:hypothetical protein
MRGRVMLALSYGPIVTIAAGIPWGVAALITSRRPPESPAP